MQCVCIVLLALVIGVARSGEPCGNAVCSDGEACGTPLCLSPPCSGERECLRDPHPPPPPSCARVRCPPGTTCTMQQMRCLSGACPMIPRCL